MFSGTTTIPANKEELLKVKYSMFQFCDQSTSKLHNMVCPKVHDYEG